ncbi:dicarboxylate/amino acid:cation symporter [Absiella sp. AM54-8XD]|uniref:Dicarboxylate/amino acid:cation symporter n=2 Tax=Amedibacillus TaxID=2749846 RepID=A0A7G9GK80_9FIRM|nr:MULTISPECIES: dicarboxylate/amino acid:cation symporter [Bacillota]QNM11212.1 dicarboxylate/amino acid:cation symporter [[Eubacterium] hominis]MCH4284736.1 dicarboxylate/amino acid:cation symporter [Amedibacillus hominis]RGB52573.1 dicarboxylate/amino acid:cation symporter [Absiella sp. AM22-9]RGB57046.1 dicarboxylate/amino acid:cation symporter [Absiella sp. AM10-20]RGC23462.1 dicarboxylate/amino acid:cation symporter [Absiella sp. AM54-8XD]
MKKINGKQLAKRMAIAMILGLAAGFGCIVLREYMLGNGYNETWNTINNLLFADISKEENANAVGIFYILGQLFINALQLIIIPMVFTSIALAMCHISDTKKLGRISYKTIGYFFLTSFIALIVAGIVGFGVYHAGLFEVEINSTLAGGTGSTASNPLMVILQAVPNNIASAFTNNGGVLGIVFLAVCVGICINTLGEKIEVLKKLLQEVNDIVVVFLSFVITKFGPMAIFFLLTRTFAIYGIDHLKPAAAYVITTILTLLLFLIVGYALILFVTTKLNPLPFLRKMAKVSLFGFSTSSSAATLPLNEKTTVEELGVSEEIASFVLPLGMTINMDGTAIMQVIAAIFIAATAGYDVTIGNIAIIATLALVASIGTPAAPGAGAVILFTILTGLGYTNDAAMLAYSLILAINRPIEMLVTSLNVIGDSSASVYVAKSEGLLDEETYHS